MFYIAVCFPIVWIVGKINPFTWIWLRAIDAAIREGGNQKEASSISCETRPWRGGEDNGILDCNQRRDLPQGKDFG